MQDFKERVAVVTGAASGIGFGMAERFARAGMKVVLADVEEEPLARAARDLQARGAAALAVPTDVAQAAAVDALAAATLDAFGAVHVVCNNAGVSGEMIPTWEQALETWSWVLGVNLWGVIHGIRTFTPILLAQGTEGHIVNTASMAGLVSLPFGAIYHASKHAVVTISESLHWELEMLGAKVKASVLCPGWVRTRIIDSDRTRPQALKSPRPLTEGQQAFRQMARQLVGAGIPAAEVAERVFAAIRDERFYVFPHPEMLGLVRERTETVLAQRNPTIDMARLSPAPPRD
jgi:NAD(P)-dependent dehydrogenase (short-subunit alcohol dehydrogenase family)